MHGTLSEGDRVLISKSAYGMRLPMTPLAAGDAYLDWIRFPYCRIFNFCDVKRNDVIVFNYPPEDELPVDRKPEYVKRCVGLPGDTLKIAGGVVYINNKLLEETENVQQRYLVNTGSSAASFLKVVQQPGRHQLPRAVGAETGVLAHAGSRFVVSAALWWMDLENELVYVGDEGTTEDHGPSRRMGVDLSVRLQLTSWLFADADLNLARNRFIDAMYGAELGTGSYLPLAPVLTSAGGLTLRLKKGFEAGLRYRYMAARPANEDNSVTARGYNVLDFTANYTFKRYKTGIVIENLLNTEWNEAQFDTESRLPFESHPVDELHFTPGTPFALKLVAGYLF